MITKVSWINLRIGALIFAIIDVLGGIGLLVLVVREFYPPCFKNPVNKDLHRQYIFPLISSVIAVAVQILLALLLIFGVLTRKTSICRFWLTVSTLLVLLKGIIVIVHLVTGNADTVTYGLVVDVVYKVLESSIIIGFMIHELKPYGAHVMSHNKYGAEELF